MRQQGPRSYAECGVWILASMLSVPVSAQYVDLEAERAAATASGRAAVSQESPSSARTDPYGAQPAQTYPATSYGVNTAPAAPTAAPTVTNASQPASSRMAGSELRMFDRILMSIPCILVFNRKWESGRPKCHYVLRCPHHFVSNSYYSLAISTISY